MKLPFVLAFCLSSLACSLDSPEPQPSTHQSDLEARQDLAQQDGPSQKTSEQTLMPSQLMPADQVTMSNQPEAGLTTHQIVADNLIDKIRSDLKAGRKHDYVTRDSNGRLPLHYAVSEDAVELLAELNVAVGTIKRGRNNVAVIDKAILAVDNFGQTPFHLMAANGRFRALSAVIDLLCSWWNSDSLNVRDNFGRTVLHLAVRSQNYLTVYELLKCKYIDRKAYDNELKTPLHYAVDERDFSIGWMLLKSDPTAQKSIAHHNKDKSGLSPYEYAKQSGNRIAEEILKPEP